jgi:hypothetical protein
VDPGSPSGHEYAIPLDQARGNAAGGGSGSGGSQPTGSGTQGQSGAPLFGVGVGSGSGSGSGGSGTGSGGSHGKPGSHAGRATGTGGSANGGSRSRSTPLTRSAIDTAAASPRVSAGSTLLVGGIAAAVLIAGALLGLTLRRRGAAGPRS